MTQIKSARLILEIFAGEHEDGMKRIVLKRGLAGAAAITAGLLFTAGQVEALSQGMDSGTCNGCHTGASNAPTRSDTIPSVLTPGTTNTYTFGASSGGTGHTRVGFHLTANQGVTLSDGGSGFTNYCADSPAPTAATKNGSSSAVLMHATPRAVASGLWAVAVHVPTCATLGATNNVTVTFSYALNGVNADCNASAADTAVTGSFTATIPCAGLGESCADDYNCQNSQCVAPDGTDCGPGDSSCVCCGTSTCAGVCHSGTCAGGTCDPAPSNTICRLAAGTCDLTETCGGSTTCPADAKRANGTSCRSAAGECDAVETCNGVSNACPADLKKGSGTACTSDGNPCTLDQCNGASNSCQHPAGNAGVTCRAAAGVCDAPEACDGASTACPADAKLNSQCRASAGACDPAESCDGATNNCPADARTPNGTPCRAAAGVCDAVEACDGASAACPADVKLDNATVCRAAASASCDIPETCNGVGDDCPADAVAMPGTVCRPAVGNCDVDEICGANGLCPADVVVPAGTSCRAASCSGGVATDAASCDGAAGKCPTAVTNNCNPYVCGPTACKSSCAADGDCLATSYCNASACQPKKAAGEACQAKAECLSANCVDGVCCDKACAGQCEACDNPGTVGTCSPSTGAPHGARAACTTDGSLCGGACNGVLTLACTYPSGSTSCRAAACDAGTNTATIGANCDGAGKCPALTTQSCAPFLCQDAFTCKGDCSTNSDCSAGFYCSSNICKPKLTPGTACQNAGQCATGNCVDGVCCDKACNGQCEACAQPGKEGTCGPVTGAPAGNRAACVTDGSPCGGSCDGTVTATCSYPSAAIACRAPSCANDVATVAASCDGAGKCPAATTQDCAPFKCAAAACAGNCTVDTDCQGGAKFCSAGLCKDKIVDGAVCSKGSDCVSGNCVDGVCCNSKCDGQCEACDNVGAVGSCTAVTGAPHNARAQCASDGTACGGACDGVKKDGCAFPGAAVECRAASCANATATLAATCVGTGSCPPVQQQSCGAFTCDPSGLCAGDCTVDGDCQPGNFCSGGICKGKVEDGKDCQSAGQCASGVCADGVCCATACDGQCQACNLPGKLGICSAVAGAPHAGKQACTGSGPCGATCDGTNGLACAFPGAATTCGAATCAGGVATSAPLCDGAGKCGSPTQKSCGNFACGTNGACKATCSTAADCASGLVCSGGACVTGAGGGAGAAGAGGKAGAGGAKGGAAGAAGSTTAGSAGSKAGSAGAGGAKAGAAGTSAAGTSGKSGGAPNAGSNGAGVPGPDPSDASGLDGAEAEGGCAIGHGGSSSAALGGLGLLVAAALGRRRRRR